MRILVVEDEFVSQKKIIKLISNLGHKIIVASDGIEGFEAWQREKPGMVITDWVMPRMLGVELCEKIRESEKNQYTYIIIVTTKNSTNDIVQGMEAGADDFITKPYIKEELQVRIRAGERILNFGARDIIIFAMAKLAEVRDLEVGNHLERIRYYSRALAKKLNDMNVYTEEINNQFINNIFITSPLHDIGKVGIPDYIRLKPDRLTLNEFKIMQDHCLIGFKTINESIRIFPKTDYLEMAAQIALYHHEKYDGSGYPNGLKGAEIPLCARIVALADVYDALITKRVYKEAFEYKRVKAIIEDSKGVHFDPQIVDAFFEDEISFKCIFDTYKT